MIEAVGRRQSEGGIYHVYSRGTGKQIIFESDDDRYVFLRMLRKSLKSHDVELFAWCLMDNHFHLLLRADIDEISRFVQSLLSPYALYFNSKHKREGYLFQGRFGSEPIDSEEYLLQAVRYIHQNPEKAGIAPTASYRWSSYQEYVGSASLITSKSILEMFPSRQAFVEFHRRESEFGLREYDDTKGEAAAKRAFLTALDELGDEGLNTVRALPRPERDRAIRRLTERGLTQRQIERFTGVSRGTIARILKK